MAMRGISLKACQGDRAILAQDIFESFEAVASSRKEFTAIEAEKGLVVFIAYKRLAKT